MKITLIDETIKPVIPIPTPPVTIDQPETKQDKPVKGKNNAVIIVVALVIVVIVVATIIYFYGKKKEN